MYHYPFPSCQYFRLAGCWGVIHRITLALGLTHILDSPSLRCTCVHYCFFLSRKEKTGHAVVEDWTYYCGIWWTDRRCCWMVRFQAFRLFVKRRRGQRCNACPASVDKVDRSTLHIIEQDISSGIAFARQWKVVTETACRPI